MGKAICWLGALCWAGIWRPAGERIDSFGHYTLCQATTTVVYITRPVHAGRITPVVKSIVFLHTKVRHTQPTPICCRWKTITKTMQHIVACSQSGMDASSPPGAVSPDLDAPLAGATVAEAGTVRVRPEEGAYAGTVAVHTVRGVDDDYAAALHMAAATRKDSGCVGLNGEIWF